MRRHRHGFTLIELLVVISIIALLVGILLPALGAARRSAQDMQCTSNLRQLMVATFVYADTHKQNLPPGDERFYSDWSIYISGLMEGRGSSYVTYAGTEGPKEGDQVIMTCPAATIDGGRLHYSATRLLFPAHSPLAGPPGYRDAQQKSYTHYNMDWMRRPTEIMFYTDGNQLLQTNPGNGGDIGQCHATMQALDDGGRGFGNTYGREEDLYSGADADNDEPIDPGPNIDVGLNAAESNVRWRHGGGGRESGSEGGQIAMAFGDGHAERKGREDVLKRHIRADGP
jgi:prepilin-type N-terminal cleavage/methylation domain-containing protein